LVYKKLLLAPCNNLLPCSPDTFCRNVDGHFSSVWVEVLKAGYWVRFKTPHWTFISNVSLSNRSQT